MALSQGTLSVDLAVKLILGILSIKMTDEVKKSCSILIRKLIASTGLKDSEFGKLLGLARQTISNYTTGKSEPNWSILHNIVELFEVNPEWLLTGDGEMLRSGVSASSVEQTPLEREMRTFEELMAKHGATPEEIKKGLMQMIALLKD